MRLPLDPLSPKQVLAEAAALLAAAGQLAARCALRRPALDDPAALPGADDVGVQPSPDALEHPPLLVSPGEAARLLSISRTAMFELLADGAIPSGKIGRRRLVAVADVEAFARKVVGGPS